MDFNSTQLVNRYMDQERFSGVCILCTHCYDLCISKRNDTYLLMALPGQLMKIFVVVVQSRLVNRMVGGQEEASKVLLQLYINYFRESCRIMKRYWHLIALKFALKMFIFKDINLGMDSTGEFNWINNNGWISMINRSTGFSYEDQSLLLN